MKGPPQKLATAQFQNHRKMVADSNKFTPFSFKILIQYIDVLFV